MKIFFWGISSMFYILLVCWCCETEWRTESENDLLIADVSHCRHYHGSELFSSRNAQFWSIFAILLLFCAFFGVFLHVQIRRWCNKIDKYQIWICFHSLIQKCSQRPQKCVMIDICLSSFFQDQNWAEKSWERLISGNITEEFSQAQSVQSWNLSWLVNFKQLNYFRG